MSILLYNNLLNYNYNTYYSEKKKVKITYVIKLNNGYFVKSSDTFTLQKNKAKRFNFKLSAKIFIIVNSLNANIEKFNKK